jgi:hypothetical protein
MSDRWHVIDYWCTDNGYQDHGAFDFYWQAADQVRALVAEGFRGGCRCKKGWDIKSCTLLPKRLQHGGGFVEGTDCVDFDRKRHIDVEEVEL